MSDIIVHSAWAPVYREPNPRAELVNQCLAGETCAVLDITGDWYHLRRETDGYTGFSHAGYFSTPEPRRAADWRGRAVYRVDGAVLRAGSLLVRLPLLARVARTGDRWELPDGRVGLLESGEIHSEEILASRARETNVVRWAVARFSGAPYLWGGITPWGADCSGMVQTAFAARGVSLPRDSSQQAEAGAAVDLDETREGDLLFFTETTGRITHVAFAGDRDTLVHSTLSCGGFIVERWTAGTRAGFLRDRFVRARRIE